MVIHSTAMKLLRSIAIFLAVVVLVVHAVPVCLAKDRIDLDELMIRAVSSYSQVSDYTCLFHRTELIEDRLVAEKNSVFRFKKPKSIYLRITEGKNKGVVTVYIEGQNKDKMVVRPKGILGVLKLKLDPEGERAMEDSRHSIRDAGIGHILQLVEDNYKKWKSIGRGTITYLGEHDLPEGRSHAVKAVFPQGNGYYGHVIDIRFDSESYLPVKIKVLDWEDRLIEEYEYTNIKLNINLTEKDFMPDRS
jgi:outer membrane lipoprotein-sorting protein